jgi:glycosyltransferase involved in cell wall biosynthesis
MSQRLKVCLIGKDNAGWAIDEEYRLTKEALGSFVDFVDIKECDVVHAVWWDTLAQVQERDLVGKKVICQFENPPYHWIKQPHFRKAFRTVGLWVAQSTQAAEQLRALSIPYSLCPYKVDVSLFRPTEDRDAIRRELGIPCDRYVIGNFNRDTEGKDLVSPKPQKAPEVFVQIVKALLQKGYPIHVLLAGPRRFWIRKRLDAEGIPYTFVGKRVMYGDDYPKNILPRERLNRLYAALDVYLITSRWEGGPHAAMEASAAKCKVVSTPVGIAADVLDALCVYAEPHQAVDVIAKDISDCVLVPTVEKNYTRVIGERSVASTVGFFKALYEKLSTVDPFVRSESDDGRSVVFSGGSASLLDKVKARFSAVYVKYTGNKLTVCLWHKFYRPPYGGGNQFMLALKREFERSGVRVLNNCLAAGVDVHICNSAWFDKERFADFGRCHRLKMIHRIDGPISLYRGCDRSPDDEIFELNKQFASVTVIQSLWTLQKLLGMGYQPIDPVVIGNAPDPSFFYRVEKKGDDIIGRKIRLVSTCWSDNPRKGGPIYKWLDEHLDWDRFEYTFVGRASESFSRIKQVKPVASRELGGLLRKHDVYITASENDPCSNALIEALSCGLPALYLNSGGHPEIVGYGGLSFAGKDDVLSRLDVLAANVGMYANSVYVPTIADIAEKYLSLIRSLV